MLYQKNSDGSSIEVKETNKGYVVKFNSNRQGGHLGRKLFVSFGLTGFQKGTDLNADLNNYTTIGDAIANTAWEIDRDSIKNLRTSNPREFKVLDKGVKIQ